MTKYYQVAEYYADDGGILSYVLSNISTDYVEIMC